MPTKATNSQKGYMQLLGIPIEKGLTKAKAYNLIKEKLDQLKRKEKKQCLK